MSKFIDITTIKVNAGNGGKGALTFRRDASTAFGGPSGGNGGDGGNIVFEATYNLNTLLDLTFQKNVFAENGHDGQHKTMNGRNGNDVVLHVPMGTLIYDKNTHKLLVDLKEDKQKFIVAKGGKGGKGNYSFKSNHNKTAELHENGELGESKELVLELKLLADIGIVGLPNAGKSTLLSKLTYAKPKIADYPFTTLSPNLGVIKNIPEKIVLADIPGLIEGASEGKGLGDEFLRHIERCKVLAHVIDISSNDWEKILRDYNTVFYELKNYAAKMINKKFLIILSKTDLVQDENFIQTVIENFKKMNISEVYTENCFDEKSILAISSTLQKIYLNTKNENIDLEDFNNKFSEDKLIIDIDSFNSHKKIQIIHKDKKWNIYNEEIKKIIHKIPPSTYQNIIRLNKLLSNYSLEKQLHEKGAKKGDIIDIYGYQLEMVDFDENK